MTREYRYHERRHSTEEPAPRGERPHRLYRSREHRVIAGVCAGLADYLGFERRAVRIVTLISLIPFPAFVILGYIAMAILLPVRPDNLYRSKEHETFWRDVSNQPRNLFGELRHRFRDLEMRLQRMETYVTSKEYEIDRQLKD